jgi:hypothetical protein
MHKRIASGMESGFDQGTKTAREEEDDEASSEERPAKKETQDK